MSTRIVRAQSVDLDLNLWRDTMTDEDLRDKYYDEHKRRIEFDPDQETFYVTFHRFHEKMTLQDVMELCQIMLDLQNDYDETRTEDMSYNHV